MKKSIRVLLCVVMVLAIALCVLVACNPQGQQSVNDSSKYAGKYYEVVSSTLSADSWIELKSDWTWADDEGETGKFTVENGTIRFYWLIDNEEAFSGNISDNEMILHILYRNVTYRKGNPSTEPSEPIIPDDNDTYTITFDVNGGDNSISPKTYEEGALLSDLPIPTREGYEFIDWRTYDNKGYDRTSVMPAFDLRLIAQWEIIVTSYEDDYVHFEPAIEGKKQNDNNLYAPYDIVNKFIYVELDSDDVGGRENVDKSNNFDLSLKVNMEYYAKDGYILNWYTGDFNTPNGAQIFTLGYGSNFQLLTVTYNSRIIRRYLVDLYVKHDYDIRLFSNKFITEPKDEPYETIWVKEGNKVPSNIRKYTGISGFTPTDFVYYNSLTESFEIFDFNERIRGSKTLYQTYESKNMTLQLNGGQLNESISIKPYTQYIQLPTPTKDGYDFIGWKLFDGKYFSDITGYTSKNYLSKENNFTSLTAEFRAKTYYQYKQDNTVKFISTVPVVTYTSDSQINICDIVYVPTGYDCTIPTITPTGSHFVSWRQYKKDGRQGASLRFDFNTKITSPIALFAETSSANVNHYVITLNGERDCTSYNTSTTYSVSMPFAGEYTLTVSGKASITVNQYGSGYDAVPAKSYTATASSPAIIKLTSNNIGQLVTFKLTSKSGAVTIGFSGATGLTEGKPAIGGSYHSVGETVSLTETERNGYTFLGWYDGNNLLTAKPSFTYMFVLPDQNRTLSAKWMDCPINIEKNIIGAGNIEDLPDCTLLGEEITLVADINDGYTWLGWYCNNIKVSENLRYQFTMTTESKLFTAKWMKCPIKIEKNIEYAGTVSGIEKTAIGQNVTISASTYSGFEWLGWYLTIGSSEILWFRDPSVTFPFNVPDSVEPEDIDETILTAKWAVSDDILDNLIYDETDPTYVVGIKDKTVSTIVVPNNVTSIKLGAFAGCNLLERIVIPFVGKSRETQYPFGYIFGTSSYTGGTGTTQYYDIYYIPSSLKKVTVTGGNIPHGAFQNCSKLTSITIPDSATKIGEYAFQLCSGLTSITIPDSVTNIDQGAFDGCYGLEAVYITDIAKWCEISVGNNAHPLSYAHNLYLNGELVTDLVIPDSVTEIGRYAFRDCSGLTSITIGNSVTSINEGAFSLCSGLKSVYYKGSAKDWSKISIDSYNNANKYITNATRYYYSENEPASGSDETGYDGKYWHYVDGVVTIWTK